MNMLKSKLRSNIRRCAIASAMFILSALTATSGVQPSTAIDARSIRQSAEAELSIAKKGAATTDSATEQLISLDSISEQPIYVSPDMPFAKSKNELLTARVIVPSVAIISAVMLCIGIIWLLLHYKNRSTKERNRLIELSIHEHTPLPDSFYYSLSAPKNQRLSSGIIWFGAGLAIMQFFITAGGEEVAPLGLIPLFVGIARIITWFVDRRDMRNRRDEEMTTTESLPAIESDDSKSTENAD